MPLEARPSSQKPGWEMIQEADYIYAFRHLSCRALSDPAGTIFLHMKYSEAVSFKGARPLFRSGVLVVKAPPGDFAAGKRVEFPPDTITLVYITKDKGVRCFTSDDPLQITPSFHYEGPLTAFRSLQDLLIYAARQARSPISPFPKLICETAATLSPSP